MHYMYIATELEIILALPKKFLLQISGIDWGFYRKNKASKLFCLN